MKKGVGKFIFTIIFLLLCGGTVFYFGWIQFSVPVDKYGVMISKTSGVHPEPIQAGKFMWRWERLLPTNTRLLLFSANPLSETITRSGELPSGSVYAQHFDGANDFQYNISITIDYRVKPQSLVSLVKYNNLTSQSELNSYLSNQSDIIADAITDFILHKSLEDSSQLLTVSLTSNEILSGIDAENRFPDIDISLVTVNSCKIPDPSLYLLAKKSYEEYEIQIQQALLLTAEDNASKKMNDTFILDRLSKLGKILTDTPILMDFLKSSNTDMNDVLSSIGVVD